MSDGRARWRFQRMSVPVKLCACFIRSSSNVVSGAGLETAAAGPGRGEASVAASGSTAHDHDAREHAAKNSNATHTREIAIPVLNRSCLLILVTPYSETALESFA